MRRITYGGEPVVKFSHAQSCSYLNEREPVVKVGDLLRRCGDERPTIKVYEATAFTHITRSFPREDYLEPIAQPWRYFGDRIATMVVDSEFALWSHALVSFAHATDNRRARQQRLC